MAPDRETEQETVSHRAPGKIHASRLAAGALLTAGLLVAGCVRPVDEGLAGGGPSTPGGGGPPAPPPPGGDGPPGDGGGVVLDPLEAGDTIGVLELQVPDTSSFILHGTMPLPPGVHPALSGKVEIGVLDYDGTALGAQIETVSRYPKAADGADVVEILARVRRNPAWSSGQRVGYKVAVVPHDAPPNPGTPGTEDLIQGPLEVPVGIQALVNTPTSVRIESRDVFGNTYTAWPLEDANADLLRWGNVVTQLKTYNTMMPTPPVGGSNGTLPHLFGVHAYLSTWSGEDVLMIDVRFNNGADGFNTGTSEDDPLDKMYFRGVDVVVPTGWVVLQDVTDPFVGAPYPHPAGGSSVYPIVAPNGDGSMHVIGRQGQFHRRLAIAPFSKAARAQALLDHEGLAFCGRGTSPENGNEFFSWWNPATARYFPQSIRMPSLDHVGLDNLRNILAGEYSEYAGYLKNGTNHTSSNPSGSYPVPATVMGWAHPWGVSYGGMTGGDEIYFFEGIRTAAAGSNLGYRSLQVQHRMQTDRMPTAFYDLIGKPSNLDKWLVDAGGFLYLPFHHFNGQWSAGQDVFGYGSAPTFQVTAVQNMGLKPAYESNLLSYDPVDYQHFIRYMRSPMALAWLGNDAISKDDIWMQAENFHMSYHEHANNASGVPQDVGLLSNIDEVTANPGVGMNFGRGEGWGLNTALAAYAFSKDDAWRADIREWLEIVIDTVTIGQSTCTGIIQSNDSSKKFGSNYNFRQCSEAVIADNAFRGMMETVFKGVDQTQYAMCWDVLMRSIQGMTSEMSWWPGEHAPWAHVSVGPTGGAPWCTHAQQLAALPMPCSGAECVTGNSGFHENYRIGSSLAYGYVMTGAQFYLQKGLQQTKNPGSMNLLQKLESDGLKYLENRAALISLAQELASP